MLKIAICDDERNMVQEISDFLSAYWEEAMLPACHVSCFSSGCALLEDSDSYDIIFLDIQMPHPDGLETARLLRRRGDRSLLIFVTVLKECVFDAFGVEAYDYLIKPLDSGRFRTTMDRALKSLEQRREKTVVIRQRNACEMISLSDLVYCEVQGRTLYLHQSSGSTVSCCGRLEELAQRVDGRFFRCHRSYLVNLDYVRGYRGGQVMLPQGEAIPVSRLREQDLTQALLHRMKMRD